ncbi:MAG: response regulator [Chitinispirillaceae bacterium]
MKNSHTKILIVEDETRLLYSLAFVLRRKGYEVTPVTNAETALSEIKGLENGFFKLIISDIHLPGMSGLDFIEKLQNMGDPTPFLVITAYKGKPIFDALENRGVRHILQKPFDSTELLDRISRALTE